MDSKTITSERPKRTEWDRQFETRTRAIERVNSIFSDAIYFKFSHKGILDQLQEYVYGDEQYKTRLTIAQKEYVRGWIDCRYEMLWRDHIAWGFKPNGVFVADFDEVLAKYHDVVEKDECGGFHYWKGTNGEKEF